MALTPSLRGLARRGSLSVALALLVACGQGEPPSGAPAPQLPPLTQFTAHPATERDAAWSPDGQWIAFGSVRSGNEDIYRKRADGTGEEIQITTEPSNEVYAVWSPDGSRLAFTSDKGGAGNVWTIPAEGGQMTRITADSDSVDLASTGGSLLSWSPDGQWIAFQSSRGGGGDIWAISVAGDQRRPIAGGPALEASPSWSPDGQWIAFDSRRSGNQDLWVVAAEGGQPRQLTASPGQDWAPSWSPDGRWIAFSSRRSGYVHIWAIPAAGGTALQVTGRPEVDDYVPRWSPDGSRISFNSQPGGIALRVMAASGGSAEPLGVTSLGGQGAWSPDGAQIAFVGAAAPMSGGWDIMAVPRSGGQPRALTAGGLVEPAGVLASLDWSPAGDEIAFTRRGVAQDLWALSAGGGEPWQLTVGSGEKVLPRYSPDGQRLAYAAASTYYSSDWDIYLMPATGGNAERLLDWPSIEWGASWSPDGRRLALITNRDRDGRTVSPWQVWTVSATGHDPQWLAQGLCPSWSPDGSEIVYVESLGWMWGPRIWKIAARGGTPLLLLEGGNPKMWPRWSPDGAEILFGEQAGAVINDIWIADVRGLLAGG